MKMTAHRSETPWKKGSLMFVSCTDFVNRLTHGTCYMVESWNHNTNCYLRIYRKQWGREKKGWKILLRRQYRVEGIDITGGGGLQCRNRGELMMMPSTGLSQAGWTEDWTVGFWITGGCGYNKDEEFGQVNVLGCLEYSGIKSIRGRNAHALECEGFQKCRDVNKHTRWSWKVTDE